MRDYIPIDVMNIPNIFDIELAGDLFTFRIDYNSVADYYTCTIQDSDNKTLITQEPLVLGTVVGIDIPDSRLPTIDLKVMDETGNAPDAGKGEFGVGNVRLYLDVVDPNGSETKDPTITPLGYDPDEDVDETTDEEVSI